MTALTDHRTAVHPTHPDELHMTFPAPQRPPFADEPTRPGELTRAEELARPDELTRPGTRAWTVTGDPHAADTGELNRLDRQALRRVAGLSTELEDVSEVEYRALRLERVILVGVWTEGTLASAENSMRELSRLAETAGSVVLDALVQRRGRPDQATYIGSGKAAEI